MESKGAPSRGQVNEDGVIAATSIQVSCRFIIITPHVAHFSLILSFSFLSYLIYISENNRPSTTTSVTGNELVLKHEYQQ